MDCFDVCGGSAVVDCDGVCGGPLVNDCADVCGGDAVADCDGICNGATPVDCTGTCNGDAVEDCSGECQGSAFVNECGFCVGGNTGRSESLGYDPCDNCVTDPDYSDVRDCYGTCNGDAYVDDCGDCVGKWHCFFVLCCHLDLVAPKNLCKSGSVFRPRICVLGHRRPYDVVKGSGDAIFGLLPVQI